MTQLGFSIDGLQHTEFFIHPPLFQLRKALSSSSLALSGICSSDNLPVHWMICIICLKKVSQPSQLARWASKRDFSTGGKVPSRYSVTSVINSLQVSPVVFNDWPLTQNTILEPGALSSELDVTTPFDWSRKGPKCYIPLLKTNPQYL